MADVSQPSVEPQVQQENPAAATGATADAAPEAADTTPAAASSTEATENGSSDVVAQEYSTPGLPDYSRNLFLQRAPVDEWIARLRKNNPLSAAEVKQLCKLVKEILVEEPTLQELETPVTVCGDVHGQFYDLEELFKLGGAIPETKYLFLGDFVDRGAYSIQTVSLLLAYKLRWPDRITMLRGNHESRSINQLYGFFAECQTTYADPTVWEIMNEVFDYFPLAATINSRIFCVHGGLSPDLKTLDQVRALNRFTEPSHQGPIPDLLWSDPIDGSGFTPSNRGCGQLWGADVSQKFCEQNGLDYIIRAHQLVMEGYEWTHDDYVLTLFSAPNYVYRSRNLAAILKLDDSLNQTFIQFAAVEREDNQGDAKLPTFFF